MTDPKYKLKHIRFKSNQRFAPTRVHNIVLELYKWAVSDYSCYRIINSFFDSNRNNNETQLVINSRIEDLKDEQEVIYNNSVNIDSFNELKRLLLSLFNNNLSAQDYRMIYSYYLEYITMRWRRTPGRFGKVVYEPLIKYKRKELFGNKDFSKSKCDVVYKNNRDKSLYIYECKFGLSTFFYHLRVNINTATGRLKKNGIRANRKIQYLEECNNVFKTSSDVINLDVKIVTLATRSSIISSVGLLRGIDLMTRDELEAKDFYDLLKNKGV
ncbi:hypothetical protein ACVRXJ_09340 [Streptococcus parasanguinis]|jgi:hypothetical protein|uniref:Uncharacterized protein n=1 Tax=Streptococcus parasanguinis (strain ATCC 15912 / DSM 6778 / CIP 104372 / LMG 14537) TaxID=760570 RepID=F8DHW1_STREP|nr:hypothetical protein [Streptococcus parasanguinis]AEH56885.1 hypothetical protein HMPREF0833_11854 [Streptococcus parasanguinis ATCC 15912]SUN83911.1 Uncharacterised protein [Streptococcus parasanguinis]